MNYVKFGPEEHLSQLVLGTWGLGGSGWDSYSDETRLDAIRAAAESGINFIDTAPAYNAGAAERYVGKALEELGLRHKMFISTKCGTEFVDGKYIRSLRKDRILAECDASLRNLRTDYIDLYLIHWPDPSIPLEETMDVLNSLKQAGKIRYIGVSNFSVAQMEEAKKYGEVVAYQPQFPMVDQSNRATMDWCVARNMGVMAYGPLGGGILTGAYRTLPSFAPEDNRSRFYPYFKEPMFSQVMRLLDTMDSVADQRGVPVAQVALNWALQQNCTSNCIVGAQTRAKVEQNCAATDWTLSEEELQLLDEAIQTNLN